MVVQQIVRKTVISDIPEEYWRRAIFLSVIDCLNNQPRDKFQGNVASSIKDVTITPNNLEQCRTGNEALMLEYFNDEVQSELTFQEELT